MSDSPGYYAAEASQAASDPRPGCLAQALPWATGAWILLVTIVTQVGAWLLDAARLDSGSGLGLQGWLAASWAYALLILLPTAALALWSRTPAYRAVYRTWAIAAACAVVLAGARIFGLFEEGLALLADCALALLCAGTLALLGSHRAKAPAVPAPAERPAPADRPRAASDHRPALLVALAIAGLVVIPAALWGALGSPIESLLSLAAGLAFGLVAAMVLRYLPPEGARPGPGRGLAVFGAGTALFILGGGFGFRGSQLLLLIALPPLGISALALGPRRPWPAIAALIGLPVAAWLALWDPNELSLLLGLEDIPGWAFRAAEMSLAIAAAVGLATWALFRGRALPLSPPLSQGEERDLLPSPRLRGTEAEALPSSRRGRAEGGVLPSPDRGGAGEEVLPPTRGREGGNEVRPWPAVLALAAWLAAGLVYARAGHPGFYGDRLFVILRDQPDVTSASSMSDRTARIGYVYNALVANAERTQARLRGELTGRGLAYRPYYLVNGLEVDDVPGLWNYLVAQPEVARVVHSQQLRPLPARPTAQSGTAPAPSGTQWNISGIGADRVWSELNDTGRGIVIGQSDSGVDGTHPALAAQYRGQGGSNDYNWIDPWYGTAQPTESGFHGTHTLGSALGRDGIGVAPGAQWIACVNLARNLGNPGAYLDCMQFMLAPYPQAGDPLHDGDPARAPHVLNNSWGCPPVEGCDAGTLAAAADAMAAAGIFVVASAGNSGPSCGSVSEPIALYPDVLAVGAIDRQGGLTRFSSRGPVTADASNRTKPDIVAPGQDVLSAFPHNTYSIESGTSMAGPHVAGVVALMWSAQPKLIGDIPRTTQILESTARPYTGARDSCAASDARPNNDAGFGAVDAYAAVKAALDIK